MRFLVAFVAAMLFASSSDAQPRVTEQAFLDVAVADDRVAAILSERLSMARAELIRAGTIPNPDGSFEHEAPKGLGEEQTWALSWSPPLDGRRGLAMRAAKAGLRAAELDHLVATVAFRNELRRDYAEWSRHHERAALATRLSGLIDRLAARVAAQAERDEASGLSARRLSLARIEVLAEASGAAVALAHARAAASVWAPELAHDSTPERPHLPPLPQRPDALALPSAEARRHEIEQAEYSARLAGRFWAMPELSFGWKTVREDLGDTDGPVFGVRWALPLFDRQQPERHALQAGVAAARGRHALAAKRAEAEFAALHAAYRQLRGAALEALAVETASEQVVDAAVAKFEAGESDVTELLETLRSVLSSRDAMLDLHGAALEAHRALEGAMGQALPLAPGGGR